MPNVKLVAVTKRFGKIIAINRVNIEVLDGEYVVVLGPTGSGKTTLLKLISGLLKPDEGGVYINGRLVNDVPPEERDVSFFFQYFALFPHMIVWDNVAYGPRVKGWRPSKIRQVVKEMLEVVHLGGRADAYPYELSGGMQQRVALARVLAAGAKLLLLDEPLSQLDAKIKAELQFELRGLVKGLGLTAIHVTNDVEEAMAVADRIIVLRRGLVEQAGSPEEVYSKPKNIFVASFICEGNFMEGVVNEVDGQGLTIETFGGFKIKTLEGAYRVGERVLVAIKPEDVVVEAGELERVNGFLGQVRAVSFIGSLVRYEVQLDVGSTFIAKLPSFAESLLEVGDGATVSFKPKDLLIYKYPEEGLMKASALE